MACNGVNEPIKEKEDKSFLNEIDIIKMSMNGISQTYFIQINEEKYDIESIVISFMSSDTLLVDSTSVSFEVTDDSIKFSIKPKIFSFGETKIGMIVSDKEFTDTTDFTLQVTYDERNDEYPTLLFQVNSLELGQLQSECPYNLDKYGLIKHKGLLSRGQSSIKDPDSVVVLLKSVLVKYSKFSNVYDESAFQVNRVSNYNPFPEIPQTDWTVTSKNQIYKDLEVMNTRILAIVHDKVVNIDGHYYNNIFIPENNIIPVERVKELLIGRKFEYECWGNQELFIRSEVISNNIKMVILPVETENHIEFRVVWKVPITDGYAESDFALFNIFVDVITGEIVLFSSMFMC